ncbi:MAG: histidine--tRNA ligase [Hyphomicrobiales bacterium]
MTTTRRSKRIRARCAKGFHDVDARTLKSMRRMLGTLERVCESYGFDPIETPSLEYTEVLGKFLPDQDRPDEGVFSLKDDDEQWLSLRYDLTAPLARYVAEHYDTLPKLYRSYRSGYVYRNEKPAPGRFRQFMQFDVDTLGANSPDADAEMCMMACDMLEALGIPQGGYRVKVNNRKILDGVLHAIGRGFGDEHFAAQRLSVLRAIDKFDRLGREGVANLLGSGRGDGSGDFTEGAGLNNKQIQKVMSFVDCGGADRRSVLEAIHPLVDDKGRGSEGLAELARMDEVFSALGYGDDRVRFDPSVVRGLGYYTGAVFEAELLSLNTQMRSSKLARSLSIGGGGRYDDLVARFRGEKVPATGFSIGVSRLHDALETVGEFGDKHDEVTPPVVVVVMNRRRFVECQRMASALRAAGVRAETYPGTGGLKAQIKYADRRGSPCVVIQGDEEHAKGEVQIKDLIEGARLSQSINGREDWRDRRRAQFAVTAEGMVGAVRAVLARHEDQAVSE